MMKLNALFLSALVAGQVSLALPGQSMAASAMREEVGTAVASCQGALPNYEGHVRKRPLSVQNEGTAPAFVTCGFRVTSSPEELVVYVNSLIGVPLEVKCTGVNGYESSDQTYSIKTVMAPASGAQAAISWQPADFGGAGKFPYWQTSVSCLIQPGSGINDTYVRFQEAVGD